MSNKAYKEKISRRLARGATDLGIVLLSSGLLGVSRVVGEMEFAKKAFLKQVGGDEGAIDFRTEDMFRATASIASYRLFDKKPICRDLDELLSHAEWFHTAERDNPIIVVDDFYDDPEAVRTTALNCNYHEYNPTWFCSSLLKPSPLNTLLNTPEIRQSLERACGLPIEDNEKLWQKRPWNGAFHYKVSDTLIPSCSIHTHQTADVLYGYNGIVYLNPASAYPPRSGLSIWLDKRTGKCVASTKVFDYGLHNFELALRIENRFNRLVLIRSDVWHSGEAGFGNQIDNARLFQTFFFEIKGKYENVVRQERVPSRI